MTQKTSPSTGDKPDETPAAADAGEDFLDAQSTPETASAEELVRALDEREGEEDTAEISEPVETEIDLAETLKRPEWLNELEQELGRPLRVLHMGNVANNAYLNAKIMRAVGIEADALAYDYYHVMGTPEWEDANYEGNIGDPFFPDWWRVNLNGFQRPGWFIQGPKQMCIDYMCAKFSGDQENARVLQARLELEANYYAYRCSPKFKRAEEGGDFWSWTARNFAFGLFVARYLSRHAELVGEFMSRRLNKVTRFLRPFWQALKFLIVVIGSVIAAPFVLLHAVFTSDYLSLRRAVVLWRWRMGQMLAPVLNPLRNTGSWLFRAVFRKRFSEVFGRTSLEMLVSKPAILDQKAKSEVDETASDAIDPETLLTDQERHLAQVERWKALASVVADIQLIKGEGGGWVEDHKQWHADVSKFRLRQDFLLATASSKGWKDVFKHYDIIQCYAVDGIIPLAGNVRPYFTYEHGTLRQIPFDNTPIGRLTATAYRNAEAAFVTNLDNLPKCDDLEIETKRVVALPHAMDDSKLLSFKQANTHVTPDNSQPPEFFCPSRQDWRAKEDMNYTKGNDIFFRALKIVADEGIDFRATLVAWGRDLEASKELLEELGLTDRVTWVEPMKKAELWKRYLSCHAVVDQFVIPAFGSVTFESLTLGRPTITRIDKKLAAKFFGKEPPVLSASTDKQVAKAMRQIAKDPEDAAGLGKTTGKWAKKYHSSQRILDLQLEAYRPTIEKIVSDKQVAKAFAKREADRDEAPFIPEAKAS